MSEVSLIQGMLLLDLSGTILRDSSVTLPYISQGCLYLKVDLREWRLLGGRAILDVGQGKKHRDQVIPIFFSEKENKVSSFSFQYNLK